MTYKGRTEISAKYYGKIAISYVYKGAILVWQAVSSCFGAGHWRNDYPWKNSDAWSN